MNSYFLYSEEDFQISKEQEIELAIKAKSGDKDSLDKLVLGNMRFVFFMAKKYSKKSSIPLEDIVQEGMIGLMRAAETFDPEKGARLATYGAFWIEKNIKKLIQKQSNNISIPPVLYREINRKKYVEETLRSKKLRDPTKEEIKESMEITEKRYQQIILAEKAIKTNIVLHKLEDENIAVFEIASPEAEEIDMLADDLLSLVKKLKPQAQKILELRYGLNGNKEHTLDAIGKLMNPAVSRERIRQIEVRAIASLQAMIGIDWKKYCSKSDVFTNDSWIKMKISQNTRIIYEDR
jgi:RNA polymerase primary sigma factor